MRADKDEISISNYMVLKCGGGKVGNRSECAGRSCCRHFHACACVATTENMPIGCDGERKPVIGIQALLPRRLSLYEH
jgi:hypothetical protein